MDITINAIHFDITEKLTAFVNKKIEKLARRYESISNVEVSLRVIKPETALNKESAIKLILPGSNDLFASKVADTFEEGIDLCIAALEPQLERAKDKK